ncbi:MAG: acyl-CoA synthetase [Acidimicrobiia bacterium]|nr:acyl-CoA synthetase [Acidimicrobiia bacterium]
MTATYNLSELFEQVVDVAHDRTALVSGDRRLTYDELDARANRLAHHLASAGVGPGDHIGLHLMNGPEYIEGMLAAFKLRAVPVNINYRYVARELEHLYGMMDLVGLVVHRRFASDAAGGAQGLADLRTVLVVDDDSGADVPEGWASYEQALAAASPERDFTGRTSDDVYCACTGGTTGMPKGVMWRHEDIFFASMGGGDPTQFEGPIERAEQLTERVPEQGLHMLVTPPLMHVSAHWASFQALFGGGKVVLLPAGSFDPAVAWRLIEQEGAHIAVIVGNAMAAPLIDRYLEDPVDASSLMAFGSGGAVLSPAVKRRMREALPNVMVMDGFGSTETGVAGTDSSGAADGKATGAVFSMDANTAVLDDELRPIEPGTDQIGRLARRGHIPLGYYNDPEKTAETFVEVDGVRWVLPGDLASVEPDGSIRLHGRGSASINTGGEKVFPEEVESALMAHDAVHDVLVVGVPDDRWGERVVAVVQPRAGQDVNFDALQAHAREHLAGYKVPRAVVVVDAVVRAPNGKPDYAWAREKALEDAEAG